MMLCWVHEGRPYKKLMPVVAQHRKMLDNFLEKFRDYCHQLLAYKQKPIDEERIRLRRFRNIPRLEKSSSNTSLRKPAFWGVRKIVWGPNSHSR